MQLLFFPLGLICKDAWVSILDNDTERYPVDSHQESRQSWTLQAYQDIRWGEWSQVGPGEEPSAWAQTKLPILRIISKKKKKFKALSFRVACHAQIVNCYKEQYSRRWRKNKMEETWCLGLLTEQKDLTSQTIMWQINFYLVWITCHIHYFMFVSPME